MPRRCIYHMLYAGDTNAVTGSKDLEQPGVRVYPCLPKSPSALMFPSIVDGIISAFVTNLTLDSLGPPTIEGRPPRFCSVLWSVNFSHFLNLICPQDCCRLYLQKLLSHLLRRQGPILLQGHIHALIDNYDAEYGNGLVKNFSSVATPCAS